MYVSDAKVGIAEWSGSHEPSSQHQPHMSN